MYFCIEILEDMSRCIFNTIILSEIEKINYKTSLTICNS